MKKTKQIKANRKATFADYFTDDLFDDLLSDPHVRIVGRKEDVLRSKDKVMAVLDAKVSHPKIFVRHMAKKTFFFHVCRGIASS